MLGFSRPCPPSEQETIHAVTKLGQKKYSVAHHITETRDTITRSGAGDTLSRPIGRAFGLTFAFVRFVLSDDPVNLFVISGKP